MSSNKNFHSRRRGAATGNWVRVKKAGIPWLPLLLLVEGNAEHRLQTANELLDEGYEVVEADNPTEAMSILKGRSDFDGIIADVYFGGSSADFTLARYVASEHSSTKVLIVADLADEESAILETGASFLKRPCSGDALLRSVRHMLAQR
jgi:DNA-binding response OmpR family regulator